MYEWNSVTQDLQTSLTRMTEERDRWRAVADLFYEHSTIDCDTVEFEVWTAMEDKAIAAYEDARRA